MKAPDLSETTWLGALIGIGGWLLGIAGFAAVFVHEPMTLLGIFAGASFMTAVFLMVVIGANRRARAQANRRISELETDLASARHQAGEWSTSAKSISTAVVSLIGLVGDGPTSAPPRVPRKDESEGGKPNAAAE